MDGLNHPQMLLSGRVGTSTPCEAARDIVNFLRWYTKRNWANNSVNNFVNPLFGSNSPLRATASGTGPSDRTFTSLPSGRAPIIITTSSVSSSRVFLISKVVNVMLG